MSFTRYIKSRSNIVLSSSQEQAVSAIDAFLNSPDHQAFVFKGAAGSGKTFISALLREYLPKRTYIFTPTGRAAKVIKSMIKDKYKRNNVSTIHHGIYTWDHDWTQYSEDKEEIPENVEKVKTYFRLGSNKDASDTIYICDESSMISNKKNYSSTIEFGSGYLLDDLFQYALNRKIVFVGDNAQLTPINMESSPALDAKYLEEKYGISAMEYELTEIMRQKKDSGILKNASGIREKISKKQYNSMELPACNDVKKINPLDAINLCAESYDPSKFENCIMITHTRKLSQEYNFKIRNKIFPGFQFSDTIFTSGDRLVCAKNNYLYEIFNGELLKVNKVFDGEEDTIRKFIKLFPSDKEKEQSKIKLQEDGRVHVELVYKKAELEYYDAFGNTANIECFLLENSIDKEELTLPEIEERAVFVEFLMRHKKEIDKYKMKHGREHVSNAQIRLAIETGEIATNPATDPFFNAVVCKYGYALTAHKSQGGEWKKAMVDFDTKFWDRKTEQYFRWCYTGITRAKEELYIINDRSYTL